MNQSIKSDIEKRILQARQLPGAGDYDPNIAATRGNSQTPITCMYFRPTTTTTEPRWHHRRTASSPLLPQDGEVKKKRHYRPGFSDRAFELISDRLVYFRRKGDSRPKGTFFG